MRKVWKAIGSRGVAIFFLVSLTALLFIGILLPDPSLLSEKERAALQEKGPRLLMAAEVLRIHSLTGSPFFLLLPGFLFLSILSRTSSRVASYLRLSPHPTPLTPPSPTRGEGTWRGTILVGNPRFWGSIVFHAGLLAAIPGIGLSMLLGFSGGVLLTEGHTLSLSDSDGFTNVGRKPISMTSLPRLNLTFRDFQAEYRQDRFPVDFTARLGIEDQDLNYSTETLKVNRPVIAGGYRFTLQRYGFAPRFRMYDGERNIFDGQINLVVFTEDQEDTFDVPGTRLRIRARFFPDYYMKNGMPHSHSVVPRNPVFLLSVFTIDGWGSPLSEGLLPLRGELKVGSLRMSFVDLDHWVYAGMTRDPGLPIIVTGFILGVLGLSMRFYLPLILHDRR